jgi:regulator of nonsense transcripts 2
LFYLLLSTWLTLIFTLPENEENKDTPHYKLMLLLEQELPECNRREQVNEIAEKFCVNHGTSKTSRKRLAKTLFLVPRTRLDLLPFYSRLTAILDRVFPDVSAPLVTALEQQFHGQAKFKKNQNVESRVKTARYIGELTKFRVAPPIISLRCIRRCLDDFNGFNIDVACCMLESCGRYLYRTKHTNAPVTAMMDAMMRISKARVSGSTARVFLGVDE